MNCIKCGNRLNENSAFCGQCGADQRAAKARQGLTPPAAVKTKAGSGRPVDHMTRVMSPDAAARGGKRLRYSCDLVVVFDCTASMTPYIEGLKDTVRGFSRDLESDNINARLGLVEYRDERIDEPTIGHGFAPEVVTFRKWISGLSATGGGDEPESAIDALYQAALMPFRSGSTRMVTLITDASYHEPGENGFMMEDVVREFQSKKIIGYVIGPSLTGYTKLADAMGGLHFDISSDPAEFRRIIRSLGKSISETVPRISDIRSARDAALGRTKIW